MGANKEELASLLAEMEGVLRTVPPRATLRHPKDENYAWLGRAAAAIVSWDEVQGVRFDGFIARMNGSSAYAAEEGVQGMMVLLHRARADLIARTGGPRAIAIDTGRTFDYFDEIRKVTEGARKDVLFIDRYLDADFVSKYLPHVNAEAYIRLLTAADAVAKLVPAVELFCQQSGLKVEIRTTKEIHDRFVIVDSAQCYLSGASFKDGARKSPTIITQIVDGFPAMLDTYEKLWNSAATVLKT